VRALLFDPYAGISGDMTIGALLDLGLPLGWLRDFVARTGIEGVEVDAERVDRRGIASTHLKLRLPHEHAHRHLEDVVAIIDGARVGGEVRDMAVHAFTLLAGAEAEVHGTTPDRVHFHEVGALDAIVDVLGSVGGAFELGFRTFYTRPVALGRGWVDMAHGHFPVPPPAVVKLLEGMPVTDPDLQGECTTPTGAAILRALTGGASPPAGFDVVRSGFGAGTRNPDDRPNCLRLVEIETRGAAEELVMLQSDLDDLPPEYAALLLDAALEAGALDCTLTPLTMKKGRPGVRVEALVPPAALEAVRAALFRNSSTLGVRQWRVERSALPRAEEEREWEGQRVRVKRVTLPGGGGRGKPELEDVVRAARATGRAPYEVYRALLAEEGR
jgi:pyridinium-3,5-bisthiocarboxylic acid mononucleotide nickel chelatase